MSTSTGGAFNAAQYLLHRHLDEGRGDHPAVRTTDAEASYAALSELVRDVAAAYRAVGLRRDDRVLFVATDDVPLLAGLLGAFHAGVVAVPVSTMLTAKELGGIMGDSGARMVVVSEDFAGTVAEALAAAPEVEMVTTIGAPGAFATDQGSHGTHVVRDFEALVDAGRAARAEDPAAGDVAATSEDGWALWLYTSGTTGQPKAAMHRHANIRHVCETYGTQVLGITADDVTFSVAKLFFAYGIGNSLFFPFSVGATTVLEPRRPSPAVVGERLTADSPTLFFGVPTFYAALVASDLPDDAFASVRWCASAGEALPAPLQKRFSDRFGVQILDGIGSTEALHIFLSNRPDDVRPGTTGRAVPGYEVEVRDEDGARAPVGQPGALYVRGESIALGYWRRTDATRQVFQGSWLSTGDTYVQDAEGYFRCLGRNTDMLKAGGIWVSPAEVESRLLEHPAVQEVAVVGLADDDGLDKPVAVVVGQPNGAPVAAEELVAWCRDGLAHFKAPRQVVHVDELPKTATGKLQRFKVRAFLVAEEPEVVAEPAPTEPAVAT